MAEDEDPYAFIDELDIGPGTHWQLDEDDVDKIPLFMDELPEDAAENPLVAGLMDIKWDGMSDEQIAEELKNYGNEAFKQGGEDKFLEALNLYTAALEKKHDNKPLTSVVYTNRAAVNLKLKNYNRVIKDCAYAIQFNPQNLKAYYRGATAAVELGNYPVAKELSERGLVVFPDDKNLTTVNATACAKVAAQEARKRREEEERLAQEERDEELKRVLVTRGVHLGPALFDDMAYKGSPFMETTGEGPLIHWPVVFLYPEHNQSDFVEDFTEADCFEDHIARMFPEPPPWDAKGQYVASSLCVYMQTRMVEPHNPVKGNKKKKLMRVKPAATLLDALQTPGFVVPQLPTFFAVVSGSAFEAEFIQQMKKA